jgi:hypothetical protein
MLIEPQGLMLPERLGKYKNSPHLVSNPRPFRIVVFSALTFEQA